MEACDLNQLLAGKERRRHELARMPIEEKLRAVVRLQAMAAPILKQRGKTVRCWKLDSPRLQIPLQPVEDPKSGPPPTPTT